MDSHLDTLLSRLGPDFRARGATDGPIPLVTIEQYFDGPVDDAALPGPDPEATKAAFLAIRDREDVADIRIGVTRWTGGDRWPEAGLLYLSTDADPAQIAGWLTDAGVTFAETGVGEGPITREDLRIPEGMHIVWFRFA